MDTSPTDWISGFRTWWDLPAEVKGELVVKYESAMLVMQKPFRSFEVEEVLKSIWRGDNPLVLHPLFEKARVRREMLRDEANTILSLLNSQVTHSTKFTEAGMVTGKVFDRSTRKSSMYLVVSDEGETLAQKVAIFDTLWPVLKPSKAESRYVTINFSYSKVCFGADLRKTIDSRRDFVYYNRLARNLHTGEIYKLDWVEGSATLTLGKLTVLFSFSHRLFDRPLKNTDVTSSESVQFCNSSIICKVLSVIEDITYYGIYAGALNRESQVVNFTTLITCHLSGKNIISHPGVINEDGELTATVITSQRDTVMIDPESVALGSTDLRYGVVKQKSYDTDGLGVYMLGVLDLDPLLLRNVFLYLMEEVPKDERFYLTEYDYVLENYTNASIRSREVNVNEFIDEDEMEERTQLVLKEKVLLADSITNSSSRNIYLNMLFMNMKKVRKIVEKIEEDECSWASGFAEEFKHLLPIIFDLSSKTIDNYIGFGDSIFRVSPSLLLVDAFSVGLFYPFMRVFMSYLTLIGKYPGFCFDAATGDLVAQISRGYAGRLVALPITVKGQHAVYKATDTELEFFFSLTPALTNMDSPVFVGSIHGAGTIVPSGEGQVSFGTFDIDYTYVIYQMTLLKEKFKIEVYARYPWGGLLVDRSGVAHFSSRLRAAGYTSRKPLNMLARGVVRSIAPIQRATTMNNVVGTGNKMFLRGLASTSLTSF